MAIIGITPVSRQEKKEYRIRFDYPEIIQKAGGIPILLPLAEDEKSWEIYFSLCDGFLFTGGTDIDPRLYHQEVHETTDEPDVVRDKMEAYLLKRAREENVPCFGICRGCQLMNIVAGGDLYQHLPSMFPSNLVHQMEEPYQRYVHDVSFPEKSLLRDILGKEKLAVNSIHHQGIHHLGQDLEVLAYATDGLIEAIHDPSKKCFMAVQWHPEFLFRQEEESVSLLRYFIQKCE